MDSTSNRVDFRLLPLEQIRANPWNPNRLPTRLRAKLRAAIKEKGMLGTLLVRPRDGYYEVVDGEHRLSLARELGLAELPCLVAELTDSEAKIKTLQLNGLRGENDPESLARLLADLCTEQDLVRLAEQLPLDRFEIEVSLELLALLGPAEAEAAARLEREPQRELFALLVTSGQREQIGRALERAKAELGLTDDAEALCAWLSRSDGVSA